MTAPRPPSIRNADDDDGAALAKLASRSFFDAYRDTDDHGVIADYCARHFTVERIKAILADPQSTVLVAEADGGLLAGYAHLAESHAPTCVGGPRPIELVRLYLDRAWIGHGVGAALMRAALDEAARRDARTLWLGVYERTQRAMAFYRRFGMQVVGTKPWEWGGETFQDPVMARAL